MTSGKSYNDIMAEDARFRDIERSLVEPSPLEVSGTTGFTFDLICRGRNRTWFAVLRFETDYWIERRQIKIYMDRGKVISNPLWEGKVKVPSFVYKRLENDIRSLRSSAKGTTFSESEMVNGDWYVFRSRWEPGEQIHQQALYVPTEDDSKTARRIISRIDKLVQRPQKYFSRLSVPVLGRLLW